VYGTFAKRMLILKSPMMTVGASVGNVSKTSRSAVASVTVGVCGGLYSDTMWKTVLSICTGTTAKSILFST
jgi:hypothetical protein